MRATAAVRIRFLDTLVPLFVASVCAALLVLVFMVVQARRVPSALALLFLIWPLWLISLAAEITLVVPLMVAVPALRKPPAWIGATWGIAAGWVFAFVFGNAAHLIEPGLAPFCAIVGACAGLAYALTARRLYGHRP